MNYIDKESAYFGNTRLDIVNFFHEPKQVQKNVLEIGAGYGETLSYLKNQQIASQAVGVDIFEDTVNKHKYKAIDRFIFADIVNYDLSEYKKHFDIILLLDVLEHIAEPEKVLQKVKTYLKDDGFAVISMPNIRHFSAFYKIFIKGSFKYEPSGLFDYTHVRFYCRKDIENLLLSNGYKIIKQEGSIRNYKGLSTTKILNVLTFGLFEEFFSYQYFFKVQKIND